MKIYQLQNTNNRPWSNQFVIRFDSYNIEILQSYNSLVCMVDRNERHITFGDDWDYSATTGRAVDKFLADNGFGKVRRDTIRKALERGEMVDDWGRVWTVANGCDDFFEDFFRGEGK